MKTWLLIALALTGCTRPENPAEHCTQAICPSGGKTYRFCSAAQASTCRYLASDGTTFTCASCASCTSAASQVASWCGTGISSSTTSGGTTGGTTTGGTTTGGSTTGGSTTGTPKTGCSGFLSCVSNCADGQCQIDCYDNTTVQGQSLGNQLFVTCPAQSFCLGLSDAGTSQCSSSMTTFPDLFTDNGECLTCLNAIPQNDYQSACGSKLTACQNN